MKRCEQIDYKHLCGIMRDSLIGERKKYEEIRASVFTTSNNFTLFRS